MGPGTCQGGTPKAHAECGANSGRGGLEMHTSAGFLGGTAWGGPQPALGERAKAMQRDTSLGVRSSKRHNQEGFTASIQSMNMPFASAAEVSPCFERLARAMPASTGLPLSSPATEPWRSAIACGLRTRSSCAGPHATLYTGDRLNLSAEHPANEVRVALWRCRAKIDG